MIKKLFSFIFCMAPVGAMAATTTLEPNADTGTIQQDGLTVAAGDVTVLQSSTTILKGLSLDSGGLSVAHDMLVGTDNSGEFGNLVVARNVQSSGFTLESSG
ncbi:hypothetical protein HDR66_01575, partial [bacterium]|nr:hypothetical protein [bacterium]